MYTTPMQAVRSVIVGGPQTTGNYADYVSACSGNMASVDKDALRIISIRMPCTGVTSRNVSWTTASCQGNNPMGEWLVRTTRAWMKQHALQPAIRCIACPCIKPAPSSQP